MKLLALSLLLIALITIRIAMKTKPQRSQLRAGSYNANGYETTDNQLSADSYGTTESSSSGSSDYSSYE